MKTAYKITSFVLALTVSTSTHVYALDTDANGNKLGNTTDLTDLGGTRDTNSITSLSNGTAKTVGANAVDSGIPTNAIFIRKGAGDGGDSSPIRLFDGWSQLYQNYNKTPIFFKNGNNQPQAAYLQDSASGSEISSTQKQLQQYQSIKVFNRGVDDEVSKASMTIYQPLHLMGAGYASDPEALDNHLDLYTTLMGTTALTLSYLDKTVAAGLATTQQQVNSHVSNQLLKQISWTTNKLANPERSPLYQDIDEKIEACLTYGSDKAWQFTGRVPFAPETACNKVCRREGNLVPGPTNGLPSYDYCVCCAEVVAEINHSYKNGSFDPNDKTKNDDNSYVWSLVDRVFVGSEGPGGGVIDNLAVASIAGAGFAERRNSSGTGGGLFNSLLGMGMNALDSSSSSGNFSFRNFANSMTGGFTGLSGTSATGFGSSLLGGLQQLGNQIIHPGDLSKMSNLSPLLQAAARTAQSGGSASGITNGLMSALKVNSNSPQDVKNVQQVSSILTNALQPGSSVSKQKLASDITNVFGKQSGASNDPNQQKILAALTQGLMSGSTSQMAAANTLAALSPEASQMVDSKATLLSQRSVPELLFMVQQVSGANLEGANFSGDAAGMMSPHDIYRTNITNFRDLYGDIIFSPCGRYAYQDQGMGAQLDTPNCMDGMSKIEYRLPQLSVADKIQIFEFGVPNPSSCGVSNCPLAGSGIREGICPAIQKIMALWPLTNENENELNSLWVQASLGRILTSDDINRMFVMAQVYPGQLGFDEANNRMDDASWNKLNHRFRRYLSGFCDAMAVSAFKKYHYRMVSITEDQLRINQKLTENDRAKTRDLMARVSTQIELAERDRDSSNVADRMIAGLSSESSRHDSSEMAAAVEAQRNAAENNRMRNSMTSYNFAPQATKDPKFGTSSRVVDYDLSSILNSLQNSFGGRSGGQADN